MKRYSPYLLLALGALTLLYAFHKKHSKTSQNPFAINVPNTTSSSKHNHVHTHKQVTAAHHSPAKAKLQSTTTKQFQKSKIQKNHVAAMSLLLKQYSSPHFSLTDVIDDLDSKKMEPLLLKESNPHTGTMYVLRTESPLPGTRYFHAQYFENKNREPYLQHMSFDVKPDRNAFQNAIRTVKSIFSNLSAPKIVKPDFIMWPLRNGYNVWIQRLHQDQLAGDPYNAYDSNDAGTIKIALELDIQHDHIH